MHPETPNLGEDEGAVVQSGAVAILLVGDGLGAVAPLEAREARLLASLEATEERLIRLVQPRQHVLQDMRVDDGEVGKIGAYFLEFSFLIKPRDGHMAPLVRRDTLLQRSVVEVAATPQDCIQRPFLLRRGTQFLFERLA
jgi:hypothetical protein